MKTDFENAKAAAVSKEDKFLEVMGNFAREARQELSKLQRMSEEMEKVYSELAEYFVFDPHKYTMDELFVDVKTFKDSFSVSSSCLLFHTYCPLMLNLSLCHL